MQIVCRFGPCFVLFLVLHKWTSYLSPHPTKQITELGFLWTTGFCSSWNTGPGYLHIQGDLQSWFAQWTSVCMHWSCLPLFRTATPSASTPIPPQICCGGLGEPSRIDGVRRSSGREQEGHWICNIGSVLCVCVCIVHANVEMHFCFSLANVWTTLLHVNNPRDGLYAEGHTNNSGETCNNLAASHI